MCCFLSIQGDPLWSLWKLSEQNAFRKGEPVLTRDERLCDEGLVKWGRTRLCKVWSLFWGGILLGVTFSVTIEIQPRKNWILVPRQWRSSAILGCPLTCKMLPFLWCLYLHLFISHSFLHWFQPGFHTLSPWNNSGQGHKWPSVSNSKDIPLCLSQCSVAVLDH